jgi:molecular chaperone DnaJ
MRQRYDQFGEAGVDTSAAGSGYGGAGMEVDLGDIFDSFFGGGGGGQQRGQGRQRQRGPVAGDDLRFDLEVDFQTAVFGGEEKVRIRHLEKCETCTGTGVKPGSQVR